MSELHTRVQRAPTTPVIKRLKVGWHVSKREREASNGRKLTKIVYGERGIRREKESKREEGRN